jgi:hypothetical protein
MKKYISFQNFGVARLKVDSRTEDLKHGYLRYYTPNKHDVKRILRAFDKMKNKVVCLYHDGYSISNDATIGGTMVIATSW